MIGSRIVAGLKRTNIHEFSYFIFIYLWGMTKGTNIIQHFFFRTVLVAIGGLAWCLCIFFCKYSKKEIILCSCLVLFATMSAIFTKRFGVFVVVMLILGSKDIEYRKIFNIFLLLQLTTFLKHALPEIINWLNGKGIEGFYLDRKIFGVVKIEEQYRISLGFMHPNSLQLCVCTISIIILYLNYFRLKNIHYILIMILNIAFYFLTFSNTSIIIITLFCLILYISKQNEHLTLRIFKFASYIFLTIVAVTLLSCYLYSRLEIVEYLSRWLTNRFKWAHEYTEIIALSLWGKDMTGGETGIALDCGYLHALLKYGIVIFSLYCIGIFTTLNKLVKEKAYSEMAVVFIFQLYFVVESFMMASFQNYSIIFIGIMLFGDDKVYNIKRQE